MVPPLHGKILSVLISLIALTSCTYNPLSSNNHLTGSAKSTAIGGAAATGVTAALGVTKPVPLIAAAAAGASIGYYVSTQRFAAAGIYQAGGQVYHLGEYLTIEIPTDAIFDVNTSELLPEAEPVLFSAASVLSRNCCNNIIVSGNTSGFSTVRHERKLSENRAREIAGFLWSQGIGSHVDDPRKLTYVGYGSYFPISSPLTNKGLRRNSRIQITSYPKQEQLYINDREVFFNHIEPQSSYTFNQPTKATVTTSKYNTVYAQANKTENMTTQVRRKTGASTTTLSDKKPVSTKPALVQDKSYDRIATLFK